jgi:1-acyl-sn-glycerol-3-phosphate acyltransferase
MANHRSQQQIIIRPSEGLLPQLPSMVVLNQLWCMNPGNVMLIPKSSSGEREGFPEFSDLLLFVYRWSVVVPILVVSTFLVASSCIILSLAGLPGIANKIVARNWARLNAFVSLMEVEVQGADKVIPGQSYVIAANHRSLVDIYLLYGFSGIDVKWVMKKELRAIPIFGLACEKLGHIVVDRSNTAADLQSMETARARFVKGTSIIFFPEGTRSRNSSMLPFKKGAFRMALNLNVPIMPVSIHGTDKILPSDTTQLKPGRAILRFHDPIPTEGLDENATDILIEKTRAVLVDALSQE